MSQNVTLQELARHLKGKLILAPEQSLDDVIVGISVIEDAVQGQLSFVSNQKYVKFVGSTKASALIVDTLYEQANCAQIVCANPYA